MGLRSAFATILRDMDRLRAEAIGARPSPHVPAIAGAKPEAVPAPANVETGGERPITIGARVVLVDDVVRETDDAVSLVLRDPSGAPFVFLPGQFLTVIVEIAGERARRSYSISSSADVSQTATITVKRVAGGKVSGYLVERARPGMRLEVLGPAGAFTPSSSSRRLVLIAGGSGITPMMSIARTALARQHDVRIDLLYGNRGERDIIFKTALDALVREHAPRLVVRHVLGEALDRATAARELDTLHAAAKVASGDVEYLLCGPEPMMHEVRVALAGRGVPDAAVREEKFTPAQQLRTKPANDDRLPPIQKKTVQLRVKREGAEAHEAEIRIDTDITILQAALAAGVELPYSCTEGGCGACRVRVADPAAVDMDVANCLSSTEIKERYILTCVSRARGDVDLEVE